MKANLIDFLGFLIVFGTVRLFNLYVLPLNLSFEWQLGLLVIIIALLELIYRYAEKYISQLYTSSLLGFLVSLCATTLALASFSQSELQQLGFNFSTEEAVAIREYLALKSLFFFVGSIAFPRLIRKRSPQ